ncbi:MAG TPA: HepT-like ribonuclease domain-containing protein [Methyloceanibacter sp.]|nr:HepT-like ribonuclease domain-containing protein [Methyloceanibacter sp.]
MTEWPVEATLEQMRQAIRNARVFTESLTYENFQADAKTRLAVERCIEIIAEAARRLPAAAQQIRPDIPWDDIKGIGNVLRHGYDKVDDRIIWTVIRRHLLPLEEALEEIAGALR